MKIRIGYVSNSSSCSFVIRKMKNSINLDLETRLKLFDDICDYGDEYTDSIDVDALKDEVTHKNIIVYCEVDGRLPIVIENELEIETLVNTEIQC